MDKVLVTGGAGFIGSHLVERLIRNDARVTIIDNFVGGSKENLKNILGHPKLEIHCADVNDRASTSHLYREIETVFHLAALADIVPSVQDPEHYLHTNVSGTVAVLEACRAAGVNRLVYAASSSCYGIPDTYPTAENSPIRVMYPYALSKHLGEQCVLHWQKVYGLPSVSLRLFNVFGPRARTSSAYGAVFGVFLAQKLAGKPFTVVGDGSQTRDFTFVTDVVDAFICAAESSLQGEVLNVGSGSTKSINRLVELLEGQVTYLPKRPGEPNCTFADISKAQRLLGWNPKVSFEDGVKVMIDSIEGWKNAPVWTPRKIERETANWFKYLGTAFPKSY